MIRLLLLYFVGLSFLVQAQRPIALENKINNIPNSRMGDSLVLISFNQQSKGDLWKVKWDFTKPMDDWFGVHLNDSGRVFCLDLDGNPNCSAERFGGNHLHGKLIDLQLPYLEHLFLSSNQIQGILPDFNGSPFLRTLQLSANKFTGQVPNFGYVPFLTKLDLEYNNLQGQLPNFDYLSNLEAIYLGHNYLTGELPTFELNFNLKQIFIEYNYIESGIEDYGHLNNLKQLNLSYNRLEGELPIFASKSMLKQFFVQNNSLTGCINLEKWADIPDFDYSNNQISICDYSNWFIPDAFSPNGDGVNDKFEILSDSDDGLEIITLTVCYPNGHIAYQSDNYQNSWDGMDSSNGERLPSGYYIIQLSTKQKPLPIQKIIWIRY